MRRMSFETGLGGRRDIELQGGDDATVLGKVILRCGGGSLRRRKQEAWKPVDTDGVENADGHDDTVLIERRRGDENRERTRAMA